MIPMLLSATLSPAYMVAWLLAARRLFAAWRPARTLVQCRSSCRSKGRDGWHDVACYRQVRKDRTQVIVDSDAAAAAWAMLAALLWPVLLAATAVTCRPPELPAERKARLAKLREDITRLEDGP